MLGAGGGVGLAAVQLGVVLGARVTAVASSRREAGGGRGERRHAPDRPPPATSARRSASVLPEGTDVVVDPVGGELAEPALRSLR